MDFLAPCRTCLQCLPFFQVPPPSAPRLPPVSESAPQASAVPDPARLLQVSPPQKQDLPSSDKHQESRPLHSRSHGKVDLANAASTDVHRKRLPEIVIAAPVSSSPSRRPGASLHEAGEYSEPPAATGTSTFVPFINDISFSTTGLLHAPVPVTPTPFGQGYDYTAGQYQHQVFPPRQNEAHIGPDGSRSQEVPDGKDGTDVLETSISTPAFLGTEIEHAGEIHNLNATMAGDSTVIETYHSEPVALPDYVLLDDDGSTAGEGISRKTSHRRRGHFKDLNPLKGIRQQIKKGGLHIKEEGSKHLQTMMININKQAQEFEQSGRLFITPRLNNN